MLDWTGERFVPWAKEAAIAYEHLHRYIWASSFVTGKRVLDLGSGEGYGSEILARRASFVCGVDIDEKAISHASARYRQPNLEFVQGCLTAVPIREPHCFDVITSFEVIEHLEQHDATMREVKRLLKPDGLFIASIPNKDSYKTDSPPNPFHVKELDFEEFNELLTRYFPTVSYLGQHVHPVSSMWPLAGGFSGQVQEFDVEHRDGEFRSALPGTRPALYFLAVASESAGAECQGSILLDCSDQFIKDKDEALDWRARQVEDLLKGNEYLETQLKSTLDEVRRYREELAMVYAIRGWQFVLKLRAVRSKFVGT
jgi:SAM-dependent methyltransferase